MQYNTDITNATTVNYTVTFTTSIEEVAGFKLFPNPAMDNVTIRYQLPENNVDAAIISLLDITGKMVQMQTIEHPETIGTIRFDLNQLQAGIYLVNVKTTGYTEIKRLVVSK